MPSFEQKLNFFRYAKPRLFDLTNFKGLQIGRIQTYNIIHKEFRINDPKIIVLKRKFFLFNHLAVNSKVYERFVKL